MTGRALWLLILVTTAFAPPGCNDGSNPRSRAPRDVSNLPPDERDANLLGREIFDLVDRAVDYRGSHRGRPGANLPQMGIESLTTTTVRRVVNIQREPVVTVAFRQAAGREILSCRGDSQVLEQASVHGHFTIMCTSASGAQRPMEVGE
jgi:hypothetical protein